jgi:hypothetical protein
MQPDATIKLRKVRDVGDVLNDTFRFIRQNIRTLGKSLLFIAGPAIVLSSMAGAMLQISGFGMNPTDPTGFGTADASTGLYLVVAMVCSIAASVLSITVVHSTVILYQDYGPGGFEVQDVWTMTKSHFWTVLLALLLIGVIIIVPIVIVLIPCLGALAYFVGLIYFVVALAPLFPMLLREQIGVIDGMKRSFALVKDQWWPTLGVVFVAGIIYMMLAALFMIPYYVFFFITMMHTIDATSVSPLVNIGMIISSSLGSLATILLYSIPLIAMALQYFSLVEMKERTGLLADIEAMDPGPPAAASGFQPPADAFSEGEGDAPEEADGWV